MAPYLGNALFKPSAGHCFLLSALCFPLSAFRFPDPEPVSVSVAVPVPVPVSRSDSGSKWLRVCWPACLSVCMSAGQSAGQPRKGGGCCCRHSRHPRLLPPSTGTRQGEERFEPGRCKMGWLDRWMWTSLRVCERLGSAVRVRCGKEKKADEMQVGT